MELSEFTIQKLARIINGDTGHTPYLSGSKLVGLFNRFGARDVYGEGFPSRWKYVEDKLYQLNGDLPPLFVPPLKLEFVFIQIVGV